MVISSNSKDLISGAGEAATWRAAARAGKTAALTPAKALLRKKRRRCGELQSTTPSSSSFRKRGSPVQQVRHQRNRNYRLLDSPACQRKGGALCWGQGSTGNIPLQDVTSLLDS